ncbi:uncharacterized protein QC763_200490 [Podospora pseudopauciseta]|uniref:Transcription factor n=1 Tax=Podospora pseudopauciseta TaxID=2093780 RepID=A0ABR0HMH9_9PEZI|nr:hypothetical protein QC763_200490 [Podospora pseudopauciseta]
MVRDDIPEEGPGDVQPTNKVFCTYCGKGFTRKEHLERHLPQHTNIKPHVCQFCKIGFSRRDLLQRHISSLHEQGPIDAITGGMMTVTGRTPISCQNCATAKTGCDKKVPCTRCAEKSLHCEARYARRSSKAAIRVQQAHAAQASAVASHQQAAAAASAAAAAANFMAYPAAPFGHVSHLPATINPSYMDLMRGVPLKMEEKMESITVDTKPHRSPMKSPMVTHPISPPSFPSPHNRGDMGMDEYMGDMTDPQYFLSPWDTYTIGGIDMYQGDPGTIPLERADISMDFGVNDLSAPTSEPMTASSSRGSHTRETSIVSAAEYETTVRQRQNQHGQADLSLSTMPTDSSIPEFEVVQVAEGAWNLARCLPPLPTTNCPRTAIVHLECLEKKSKQEGTWSSLEKYLEQAPDVADLGSVVPIKDRTRDQLLAITQGFLYKALDIHRSSIPPSSYRPGHPNAGEPSNFNYIVLPPSKILEYFLSSYVRSLSVYYPLVNGGVDPNEMLLQDNLASTLLVLLMIAQGAAAMPMAEARYLSAGLTETCRISLFDIVEKDVELSADPITLRCALLFLVLGAWSGDKWLMDIAMGQRGMYISMLKHASMMESQPAMIPVFNKSSDLELEWHHWKERERRNRLVYNYVMLDQELSLFHDVTPLFAITELKCPLPGPEPLWQCQTSAEWLNKMQSAYGSTANVNPQLLEAATVTPSLCDLFQDFLHDNLSRRQSQGGLSPQQLRLLLHPIQSLICHLRQMLSCFSDVLSGGPISRSRNPGTITRSSTQQRMDEVQTLLAKWYDMTRAYLQREPNCPITRCNLVLYHLISLNATANFPEIERLARREAFSAEGTDWSWELNLRSKRCIFQRDQSMYHCGQVFKLLRAMPNNRRPAWWSAAMYRATMVLWAMSLTWGQNPGLVDAGGAGAGVPGSSTSPVIKQQNPEEGGVIAAAGAGVGARAGAGGGGGEQVVVIDQITTEEEKRVMPVLWEDSTVVALTRLPQQGGGTVVIKTRESKPGESSGEILRYAIQNIDAGFSSRVGDGIKRKLEQLGKNWDGGAGSEVHGLPVMS